MFEILDKDKRYAIKLQIGLLVLGVSKDKDYPGIDIEFLPHDDDKNTLTRPRILIEAPVNEETGDQRDLRALVWADPESEDYSDEINFLGW